MFGLQPDREKGVGFENFLPGKKLIIQRKVPLNEGGIPGVEQIFDGSEPLAP